MQTKLVITKFNQKLVSVLIDEKAKFLELYCDNANEVSILNNIYIGKVMNIVRNINAAFIQFDDNKIGYYSIEENKNPIFINKNSANKLCIGDELIVQVIKEGVKTKDPVLTSNIELCGNNIILTLNKTGISFSKKLNNLERKAQIKLDLEPIASEEFGFIVRTNANNSSATEILEEAKYLSLIWKDLFNKAKYRTCFTLLLKSPQSYITHIRDLNNQELLKIITDDIEIYEQVKEYLQIYQNADIGKLVFYQDDLLPLYKLYSIEKCLHDALSERVWLKSGAYLIIQPTEALVVIDVNSGKNSSNKKVKNQMLKINLEAAKEIADQLRLRNLSGIIIVDFINMENESQNQELIIEFDKLLKNDRIKTTLVDMTKLNLVELTRKKVRKPIYEQLKD